MANAYNGGMSYLNTLLATLPDIAVNYMFVAEFDLDGSKLTFKTDFANLAVKARTGVIPGRTTEQLESNFMGSKQVYPAKTTYSHETTVKFEEFQDGGTHALFKNWQDAIYDINTGVRISNYKKDYSGTMTITVFGTDGIAIMPPINFFMVWVKGVSEPTLDHDAADKITFDVTFAYDRWDYQA